MEGLIKLERETVIIQSRTMGVTIVLLMDRRVVMVEDVMKVPARVRNSLEFLSRNYAFGIS